MKKIILIVSFLALFPGNVQAAGDWILWDLAYCSSSHSQADPPAVEENYKVAAAVNPDGTLVDVRTEFCHGDVGGDGSCSVTDDDETDCTYREGGRSFCSASITCPSGTTKMCMTWGEGEGSVKAGTQSRLASHGGMQIGPYFLFAECARGSIVERLEC